VGEIESERNILTSTMKGMYDIIKNTNVKVDNIVIDGNHTPYTRGIASEDNIYCDAIINGDDIFIDIAAASIVAKVTRDGIMESLSKEYDDKYSWNKNMGYGTKEHYEALKVNGLSDQHRKYWFENKQESFIY
jgi:ribonuclease HII